MMWTGMRCRICRWYTSDRHQVLWVLCRSDSPVWLLSWMDKYQR